MEPSANLLILPAFHGWLNGTFKPRAYGTPAGLNTYINASFMNKHVVAYYWSLHEGLDKIVGHTSTLWELRNPIQMEACWKSANQAPGFCPSVTQQHYQPHIDLIV